MANGQWPSCRGRALARGLDLIACTHRSPRIRHIGPESASRPSGRYSCKSGPTQPCCGSFLHRAAIARRCRAKQRELSQLSEQSLRPPRAMQHATVAAEAQVPCIHVQSHVVPQGAPGRRQRTRMLHVAWQVYGVLRATPRHRPDLAVDAGPEVLDVIREVHCAVVAAPTEPTTSHHTQRTPRRSAGAKPTKQRAKPKRSTRWCRRAAI
jgi:hypothetical protein